MALYIHPIVSKKAAALESKVSNVLIFTLTYKSFNLT